MDANKWTDKELEKYEKEIKRIYKQASKEVNKKASNYFSQFKEADKEKKAMVDSGEMTKAQYKNWRQLHMTTGQGWRDMKAKTAMELTRANERATAYVNGQLPKVYVQNYNAVKSSVDGIGGYSFDMVNENSVKYVFDNIDKSLLPTKGVNASKDVAWNSKKINSEVLQGIIQGEPVDKIAGRLERVSAMSTRASIRNARTMVTGTQNRGKLDSYERAADAGIDIKKEWVATLDNRTREAHGELDGVSVPIDEPFTNSIGDIMFPGDPDCKDPENVYNCRCTLVADVGHDRGSQRVMRDEDGKSVLADDMTYEEWYEAKTGKPLNPEEPDAEGKPEFDSEILKNAMSEEDYEKFKGQVQDSEARSFYDKYMDEMEGELTEDRAGGYYTPASDSIHFSYSSKEGKDRYSTLAHESFHMFDAHMGRVEGLSYGEVDLINERCGLRYWKPIKVGPSQSDEFLGALRKDAEAMRGDWTNVVQELRAARNATSGIQDALDGFYGTFDKYELPWGHGDRYYNRKFNTMKQMGTDKEYKNALQELGINVKTQKQAKEMCRIYETASEAWANAGSALTTGGETLEYFEKYMPHSLEVIRGIAGGM